VTTTPTAPTAPARRTIPTGPGEAAVAEPDRRGRASRSGSAQGLASLLAIASVRRLIDGQVAATYDVALGAASVAVITVDTAAGRAATRERSRAAAPRARSCRACERPPDFSRGGVASEIGPKRDLATSSPAPAALDAGTSSNRAGLGQGP